MEGGPGTGNLPHILPCIHFRVGETESWDGKEISPSTKLFKASAAFVQRLFNSRAFVTMVFKWYLRYSHSRMETITKKRKTWQEHWDGQLSHHRGDWEEPWAAHQQCSNVFQIRRRKILDYGREKVPERIVDGILRIFFQLCWACITVDIRTKTNECWGQMCPEDSQVMSELMLWGL